MGLSIHYSGSLRSPDLLPELIEEVKDIVEVFKWEYGICEEKFPADTFGKKSYNQNIYGIYFTIPECETISICFLSNGRMASPANLKFYGNSDNKDEQNFLYMISVKTQFAGIKMHKFIIHLFKHLNKKYFQNFKMFDEGDYWETEDEKLLESNFKKYTALLDSFSFALENQPIKPGESVEAYLKRLLNQINDRKNKRK